MRYEIIGPMLDRFDEVLTPEALEFLVALDSEFAARRVALLDTRRARRARYATGQFPDFLPETAHIRADPSWRIAPPAPGLVDRRVEITGPTDRKMTINALNSGAKVWLADFEDATAPTWSNVINGQLNLIDALDRRIDFTDPRGKRYALGDELATIVVRPRGWHLVEKGIAVDGRPISATLVDFGLYLYHCARRQLDAGRGPYFYLPKLETHREARLWNDVFVFAQHYLGLPVGTIRATVLIETITAAFEMEEILYELREHSAGLNAGRWDYIFSMIKNFGQWSDFVLPDRTEVTMTVPFMRAYTELLVSTCHRRGAHAIGGMAAFIPSRDPQVNENALARVRADKQREATDGFDGSWVAHPGLVEVCREVFDARLGTRPHQIDRLRDDVRVTAADLLAVDKTPGQVTGAGLRSNVAVALRYVDAWLGGVGAVALWNLMEDAATAEIARCQVWQWLHHGTPLADGGSVTEDLVRSILAEELAALSVDRDSIGVDRAEAAARIVEETMLGEDLPAFFTTRAYARHLAPDREAAAAPALHDPPGARGGEGVFPPAGADVTRHSGCPVHPTGHGTIAGVHRRRADEQTPMEPPMTGLRDAPVPGLTPLWTHDPVTAGPYRLVGRLGAGGQGVVFLGQDAQGQRVAVKMINADLSNPRARAQFVKEISAARRVAPFCTAQVLFADVDGEQPYVVSEFIPGPTLYRHVREHGPIAGNALHRLAVGTATALAAIHRCDVVHCDFKPDNVVLGPDGPRVIDFGIARALGVTETVTSQVVGTTAYMAPERFRNDAIGPACDVFAWAGTIAFAAGGRPPFGNDSLFAVMHRVLNDPPDLAPLPPSLDELIRQCLAKDPADRPTAEQTLMRLLGQDVTAGAAPQDAMLEVGRKTAGASTADQPVPLPRPAAESVTPSGVESTAPLPVGSTQPTSSPAEPAPTGGRPRGRLVREATDAWGISTAIFLGAVGGAAGYVASGEPGPAVAVGTVAFGTVYLVRLLVAMASGGRSDHG